MQLMCCCNTFISLYCRNDIEVSPHYSQVSSISTYSMSDYLVSARISPDVLKITASISSLSSIICLCGLITLLMNTSIRTQKVRPMILSLTYGSIGCYSISMMLLAIGNIFLIISPFPGVIIIGSFALVYTVSQVLVYWLLIYRVYHAFEGTVYSISKRSYTFVSMMIITYLTLSILNVIYNGLAVFDSQISEEMISNFGLIIAASRDAIDLIITIFLIAIFNKKLFKVTVDIDYNRSESIESSIVI